MKVLVSTIQPLGGGVPSMLRFVIDTLREQGHSIALAYYEPYSLNPSLSVPVYQLPLFKSIGVNDTNEYFDCRSYGIGSWLPELEFTHYWATRPWRDLIRQYEAHITVSGSCLAALPFVQTNTPFLAWIASDWQGDREHRVNQFPWFRRALDRCLVKPFVRRLEKRIVNSGALIALSKHTQATLNNLVSDASVTEVLTMPIDIDLFKPRAPTTFDRGKNDNGAKQKIGFVSRFEDPRKNLPLLLRSMVLVLQDQPQCELVLVGDKLSTASYRLVAELGIYQNVSVHEYVERDALPDIIRQLDVFVLPSHQEGLCIAALEAMSCAVPVVSTRCGGPQDYIISGQNGLLCDSKPASMAAAILQLLSNTPLRLRYAKAARETVVNDFNPRYQSQALVTKFDRVFK